MSAFVIKIYEFGVGDKLYASTNEKLWEWLISDENLLGLRAGEVYAEGSMRVLCPEGFVFYDGMLVPLESNLAVYPPEPKLCDFTYISGSRADLEKVLLLILNPYTKVTPIDDTESKTLHLEEDRIFEITLGID